MMQEKKSQVLIFATIFLILLLLVTYSLETRNSYKPYFEYNSILGNIKFETCQVGNLSNGSYIDSRFSSFETSMESYCTDLNIVCDLEITKDSGAPTNLSELNYTHYEYEITFEYLEYNYSGVFNC